MNTPKDPSIHFPINYGWVNGEPSFDPVAETYVRLPSEDGISGLRPMCSVEARDLVAETLLFSDEQFRHLTRNASKAGWLVFLTVTPSHAYIVIHEIEEEAIRDHLLQAIADGPTPTSYDNPTYSAFIYTPRVEDELVLFPKAFVDNENYLMAGDHPTGYVLGTPLVTAWRCLKPTEIAKFAPVYRTVDALQLQVARGYDDTATLNAITQLLNNRDWDADTLMHVRDLIVLSGREVSDLDDSQPQAD